MYYCEGCKQAVDWVRHDLMLGNVDLCDACMEQEMENLDGWWKEDTEAYTPPEYCE